MCTYVAFRAPACYRSEFIHISHPHMSPPISLNSYLQWWVACGLRATASLTHQLPPLGPWFIGRFCFLPWKVLPPNPVNVSPSLADLPLRIGPQGQSCWGHRSVCPFLGCCFPEWPGDVTSTHSAGGCSCLWFLRLRPVWCLWSDTSVGL